MLSPGLKRIFSPGTKRKREESTPMKRVRAKLDEGCDFEDDVDCELSCRALCDCVIACSAAKTEVDKRSALDDLEELLDGEARKGVHYEMPEEARLSGTPLYVAAMLDCPEAAELLLTKGEASLVARFEKSTPIQAAIERKSAKTLEVLLDRVKYLEGAARSRANHARPQYERSWTHSTSSGLRDARLHRRDEDDSSLPSGRAAHNLETSDGWAHAKNHDAQPKLKSTRRRSSS